MPDFGLFRGFSDKIFAGQVPTNLGSIGSTTVFDPDAASFFSRVATAGGTLSATEQSAINTLVIQMKADNIWTAMKAIYPMVGASAAACAQNLVSASFTGTFTSGWTYASTGVTPNGSSAYFNTTFKPFENLSTFSSHFSYYSRTNIDGTYVDMGCQDGATSRDVLHIKYAGVAYYDQNDQSNGRLSFSMSGINSTGLAIMSRTANNLQIGQVNGVTRGTNTSTTTTILPNTNVYVGAANLPSLLYTPRQCAFASMGDGLTSTQAGLLYTAVQAFQTTLGRQV